MSTTQIKYIFLKNRQIYISYTKLKYKIKKRFFHKNKNPQMKFLENFFV